MQYGQQFDMPDDADENLLIPFGTAALVREGSDLTIVATSSMVEKSAKVADYLAGQGVRIEVIDPRTIKPLDKAAIIKSVKKTGKLLIVDEGYTSFGLAAEIGFSVMPDVFYDLEAPISRLCAPDVPVPFSPSLEKLVVPNENMILDAVKKML